MNANIAKFDPKHHAGIVRSKWVAYFMVLTAVSFIYLYFHFGWTYFWVPVVEWLNVLTFLSYFIFMSFIDDYYETVHLY